MVIPLALAIIVNSLMWLSTKSIWADETHSIFVVSHGWLEIVKVMMKDVHPPAYFLLLKLFSHNELTMRLLSHLATIGTVVASYKLAEHWFNRRVALYAGCLIALSPYFLQSSNELRGYALFGFLVTLATLAYEKGWAKTFFFASVACMYTETYSWIWWAAITLRLLLDARDVLPAKKMGAWLATMIAVLPAALLTISQMANEQVSTLSRLLEYWNPIWMVKKLVGIPWHMIMGYSFTMLTGEAIVGNLQNPLFWLSAAIVGIGVFLAAFGAGGRARYYLLACLVVPTVFLLLFYPIRLHARYLIFAAPFLYIPMAYGLELCARWVKVVFLGALAVSCAYAISLPTDSVHRHNYKAQVENARLNCRWQECSFLGNAPQVDYYSGIPAIESIDKIPQGLMSKTIWLLDLTNMHEKENVKALNYYKKQMAQLGYTYKEARKYGMNITYCFERA